MAQLVTGVALFVKLPAARFRRQPEGAAPLHKAHHRFAQLAEGGRAQAVRAAGLVVKQDGGKDRFHVAAHTVAVVVEDRGDARHIGRAGVAGHQPLDHLPAEKRADVGVVKERVEGGFQRLNQIKPNFTRAKQTTPVKNKPQVQLTSVDKKQPTAAVAVENTYSQGYIDSYGIFHSSKTQQQQQPSYLNFQQQQPLSPVNPTANYYYQNYPASTYNQQTETLADDSNQNQNPSSYQTNYQNYPPMNYQYHANNQYPNYNQLAFDGNYNGNRPFVIESSAPSYLEQHGIRATKKPFKKESYATSPYDADDENEYDTNVEEESDNGNDENLSDYLESSNGDEYYQKPLQDEIPEPQKKPVEVVEELICSLGTRQANSTSCLKYYVCNPMTKEVLSYTCPAFTAFNDRTRICDVASYSTCQVKQEKKNYSYNENQKMFQQAFKALEQAKKESQRAEKIASLVRKESQKIMNNRRYPQQVQSLPSPVAQSSRPIRVKKIKPTRPQTKRNKLRQSGISNRKKKGQLCPDVVKVADPDTNNFVHCFVEKVLGMV